GAEDDGRAALHHFEALDRVIQAEEGARVHVGEVRRAVERHTHDHVGEERRIAAARVARYFDIGYGLAARGLRPDARRDLEHVRGAERIRFLDQLAIGRNDVVAGIELP